MSGKRKVALVLDPGKHSHRKIIMGVAAYVREQTDWTLHIEEAPGKLLAAGPAWQGNGVITAVEEPALTKKTRQLGISMVGVEDGVAWVENAGKTPYFATDSAAVGRLGAEHLIAQGFRNLAYCDVAAVGPTAAAEQRAQAFAARAKEAGLPCTSFAFGGGGRMNWFDLHLELSQWLQTLEKPLGIMAGNDVRARQVLEACKSVGLRVPDDVAVLGVDNDEMMCELGSPALTSIEYGAHKLGYEAAALLARLMTDRGTPCARRNLVPPQGVVARQSTDSGAIGDVEVAAAVQFIRQRACDPIQVSDVLDLVQVSRSTLKRRFKAITGRTVLAEIQRVRIERAKQLLRGSELSLREIATQTGFCSLQYLNTVFYQHVGQTPAEFRRSRRR